MHHGKKTPSLKALGLAAVLLCPVSYVAADEVVVLHDHPGHHERVRERRAEERAAERARIREHERHEAAHERHERHERRDVHIRP